MPRLYQPHYQIDPLHQCKPQMHQAGLCQVVALCHSLQLYQICRRFEVSRLSLKFLEYSYSQGHHLGLCDCLLLLCSHPPQFQHSQEYRKVAYKFLSPPLYSRIPPCRHHIDKTVYNGLGQASHSSILDP